MSVVVFVRTGGGRAEQRAPGATHTGRRGTISKYGGMTEKGEVSE